MASLRSIKAGLSKSYHSLNTFGNDNDVSMGPNGNSSQYDWLGMDNDFRKGSHRNKPLGMIKNAVAKVSGRRKAADSRVSDVLRDLNSEWSLREDGQRDAPLGRLRSAQYSKMPSSVAIAAEQASLLGNLSENPDEIDLRQVKLTVANTRSLSEDGSTGNKETVETQHGPITIAVAGDRSKPVLLTYHDLGLNHVTNFQAFMLYPELRNILQSFCVVHVNAPGQEEGAPSLPEGYIYPTMEELAETICAVKNFLHIRSFIGFGVGLGANVLARFAVKYPNDVDALALINCSSTTAGWIEWGYQKLNVRHMRGGSMTSGAVDYLLWHHFGKLESCNQDLVTVYRQHFEKNLNATNLALLVDSYIRRTDLGIVREMDPNKKKDVQMIRCPTLNVTGNFSPHIDDTVTFNGRLDPANSTWMKIQDCGLVIDEMPGKVSEAFKLFLQGMGYAVSGSRRTSSVSLGEAVHSNPLANPCSRRSLPVDGQLGMGGATKDIRITENPLQNPTV